MTKKTIINASIGNAPSAALSQLSGRKVQKMDQIIAGTVLIEVDHEIDVPDVEWEVFGLSESTEWVNVSQGVRSFVGATWVTKLSGILLSSVSDTTVMYLLIPGDRIVSMIFSVELTE